MLYKQDGTGKLKMIVAVYVDNVLFSSKEEEMQKFKTTYKDTYKIIELGKVKKHLEIWYEWINNKDGSSIKMHIDDMARKIVKEYKELTHGTVKE